MKAMGVTIEETDEGFIIIRQGEAELILTKEDAFARERQRSEASWAQPPVVPSERPPVSSAA